MAKPAHCLVIRLAIFSFGFLFRYAAALQAVVHDQNHFEPHYILRVTQQNITLASQPRLSAVVNGRACLLTIYLVR